MTIIYVLVSLFFLNAMIFVHELFHLLAAKWLKIEATEFAIGMGPSLFAIQKQEKKFVWSFFYKPDDETLDKEKMMYHIRLVPIGGYVSFGRETNGVIEDGLGKHVPWKRILVALAGPVGNLLFAVVLMAILLFSASYNGPGILVTDIVPDSLATNLALQPNDAITKINDTIIAGPEDLVAGLTNQQEVCAEIIRDGKTINKCAQMDPSFENKLGIYYKQSIPAIDVLPLSVKTIYDITKEYIHQFITIIYGLQVEQLSGPIGIVDTMQENVVSFDRFVTILILVNIALGIGNLLFPFSITDGGRIVIDLLAIAARKHSLPTKYLDIFCVLLMILMFITTTYLDITRLLQ